MKRKRFSCDRIVRAGKAVTEMIGTLEEQREFTVFLGQIRKIAKWVWLLLSRRHTRANYSRRAVIHFRSHVQLKFRTAQQKTYIDYDDMRKIRLTNIPADANWARQTGTIYVVPAHSIVRSQGTL